MSYSGLYRKVELPDRRICTPSSLLLINTVNYCSKPYVSELLPAMCKESHLVLICVCWSLSEVGHLFTFMRCVGLSCDLPFPVLCFILFGFLVSFWLIGRITAISRYLLMMCHLWLVQGQNSLPLHHRLCLWLGSFGRICSANGVLLRRGVWSGVWVPSLGGDIPKKGEVASPTNPHPSSPSHVLPIPATYPEPG